MRDPKRPTRLQIPLSAQPGDTSGGDGLIGASVVLTLDNDAALALINQIAIQLADDYVTKALADRKSHHRYLDANGTDGDEIIFTGALQ